MDPIQHYSVYGPANPATGTIGGMGQNTVYGPANPQTGAIGGMGTQPKLPPKPPAQNPGPQNGQFLNEFGQWTPIGPPSQPDTAAINAAYDPLLNYLGQAETQLRADYPTYTQDINNQADTSKQTLGNNYSSTVQQLSNQGEQGAKQRDNVVSAAQRLYQELQQANLQRFGAGSSGQFASELQGRELQHNTGTAQGSYTDLTQQLGQKKIEIDANYQTGLKQIEDQRQAAVNQINRDFQDKLMQINQQRGAVESQKAQARLDALQQYRDQVYQIQLQNYQMQQQLTANHAQQTSTLNDYATRLNGAGADATKTFNQYQSGANYDPTSQFAAPAYNPNQTDPYTGQILNPTKKNNFTDMPAFNPTG